MRALVEQYSLGRAGMVWFVAIALAIFAAVAAWLFARRRLRHTQRIAGLAGLPPQEARRIAREVSFFADALDMLEDAGFPKPAPLTPRQHVAAITLHDANAGGAFARLVERFYRVRYGGLAQSISDREETRDELLRLKSALSRRR